MVDPMFIGMPDAILNHEPVPPFTMDSVVS
jgi:hypothetical protein